MASKQQDPIPAVSGDNVDERYVALREHLLQTHLSVGGAMVCLACPHEADREKNSCLHRAMRGYWVLCHDCKALVMAYEAKRRAEAEEKDQKREAVQYATAEGEHAAKRFHERAARIAADRPMTATELREKMSEVNPAEFKTEMMGEAGEPSQGHYQATLDRLCSAAEKSYALRAHAAESWVDFVVRIIEEAGKSPYVERHMDTIVSPCPRDTDGDGDCGRPGCPRCSIRREPRGSGRTSRMIESLMAVLTYTVPKSVCVVMPNSVMARDAVSLVATKCEERSIRIDRTSKLSRTLNIAGCRVDFVYPPARLTDLHDFYIIDHWAFEHWGELMMPAKPRDEEAVSQPEPRFAPGDVVQLKSGGPKMTINATDMADDDDIVCDYFSGDEYKSQNFNPAQLTKLQ